jgi:hypothetical protein
MRLVMTLLARDERDIIRENLAFHRAQGVDFFVVIDNRSADGTTDILKAYEASGVLAYIPEDGDYNQRVWVTRLARMAYRDFGADWVINNDADEFWWPTRGSLKDVFERLPSDCGSIEAVRHNFVPVVDDGAPFYRRMRYRETASLNPIGMPLPPKVAHRGSDSIVVGPGNHSVMGLEDKGLHRGGVEIFHFPIRGYAQLVAKTVNTGEAYERNTELPKTTGLARRRVYETYKRNGNSLRDYYEQHLFTEERIAAALEAGSLVEDARLASFLDALPEPG